MKKYLAYAILSIGLYLSTCLVLFLLNLIGIGTFDNILYDAFCVTLLAGVILIAPKLFKGKLK